MSGDLLALAVMGSVAVSCSAAVLFLSHLKARRARLHLLDDSRCNAAHGDWPFVPTDDFKPFHEQGDTL